MQLGLVGQYRVWVLPAAESQGVPLFTGLAQSLRLRLVESTGLPAGILEVVVSPAGYQGPQTGLSGATP
jgi:hypothetical protein